MIKPPRPNFDENQTSEEQIIISKHFEYLKQLLHNGKLVMAGRCENATYGLIIVLADSLKEAEQIMENDPAIKEGIFFAQIWPFRIALSK
jgi:uncharacterized protein YciI